jgi:hypothetical protein
MRQQSETSAVAAITLNENCLKLRNPAEGILIWNYFFLFMFICKAAAAFLSFNRQELEIKQIFVPSWPTIRLV